MSTTTATPTVTTYADGYGAWHASLENTGSDARNRELARNAIARELIERGEVGELHASYLRAKQVAGSRSVPGSPARLTFAETWPTDWDYPND